MSAQAPGPYVGAVLLFGLTSLAAAALPAYRASRVDSLLVLRPE